MKKRPAGDRGWHDRAQHHAPRDHGGRNDHGHVASKGGHDNNRLLQARWAMKLRTAVLLIVGLVLACPSYAQITGRILGVVRDESRAVLPGATGTATSPVRPGRAVTATTNGQGEYQLLNLPPGVYQITVELT